jgi:hypothetical protein
MVFLGSVLPAPSRKEFTCNPICFIDVVEVFQYRLTKRFVKVHVRGLHGILNGQNEFEADGSFLVVYLDRHLAADLHTVCLYLTGLSDAYN